LQRHGNQRNTPQKAENGKPRPPYMTLIQSLLLKKASLGKFVWLNAKNRKYLSIKKMKKFEMIA